MGVVFNRCERESFASAGRTVSLGAAEAGVCGSAFGLSLSTPPSCGPWSVDAHHIFVVRRVVVVDFVLQRMGKI